MRNSRAEKKNPIKFFMHLKTYLEGRVSWDTDLSFANLFPNRHSTHR